MRDASLGSFRTQTHRQKAFSVTTVIGKSVLMGQGLRVHCLGRPRGVVDNLVFVSRFLHCVPSRPPPPPPPPPSSRYPPLSGEGVNAPSFQVCREGTVESYLKSSLLQSVASLNIQ